MYFIEKTFLSIFHVCLVRLKSQGIRLGLFIRQFLAGLSILSIWKYPLISTASYKIYDDEIDMYMTIRVLITIPS